MSSDTRPLDGLRGVAILMVFAYHAWLFSWYTPQATVFGVQLPVDVLPRVGYLGVDLFFLISGFCLFFPHALHAVDGKPLPGLRDFAYRRFIKIVPSYAVALAATAAISLGLFSSGRDLAWALLNHSLFINNSVHDAFGKNNSVFWSLGVEIQFYLIFPLLAVAFRRAPVFAALGAIGAAQAYRWANVRCCLENEAVMRQVPAYLDLFACGMLAAWAYVALRRRFGGEARHAGWFTLAAVVCAAAAWLLIESCNAVQYVDDGRQRWDLMYRTPFALAGAGLALSSCFAYGWWRALIANRFLIFLSLVSYNLYLWHTMILLWLLHHHIPHATTPVAHDDAHWRPLYLGLATLLAFAVAAAVTYFLERPLLSRRKQLPFSYRRSRTRANPLNLPQSSPIGQPETRT
jgi:peptidoglycan/LPS O-acetylase OafA/YrhL